MQLGGLGQWERAKIFKEGAVKYPNDKQNNS